MGQRLEVASSGYGTVFAINRNGTGFTNLVGSVGSFGGLILSGDTLYGTAPTGGSSDNGRVFAVSTSGTGFTNIHSLTATDNNTGTNIDGAHPYSGLILSGNALYGTALDGGNSRYGTVFALNTNGTGFRTLHSFTATAGSFNSDGVNPVAGLILSGETVYGTTKGGTVIFVATNTIGMTNLLNNACVNIFGGLILSGNTLYGTIQSGISTAGGTVFAVSTNGTSFRTLHIFTFTDGAYLEGGLILSGNTLYGTASYASISGQGTVFSIFIQPQLTILPSGQSVILTWPTNYDGFALQSATNLASPVWTTNSPPPATINGQNTVTNPISGSKEFFRLSQ